jgi:bacterioferritin-associated ferredoxin
MYMCLCRGLTEPDVKCTAQTLAEYREALDENALEDSLISMLGLDARDACGQCAREIDRFVAVAVSEWCKERPTISA